jgi:uncharacterized protein YwgA
MKELEFSFDTKNKKIYQKTKPQLLSSDLILMLLSVSPIKGNTKLQKQVFLAWKEIFGDIICELGFFPYRYGAYSRLIEDASKILLIEGKMKIEKRKGEGSMYFITKSGKITIKRKMKNLELRMRDLPERKIDWDDWSPKGILRYVYRKYPEYTTKTKVPSLKW